MKFFFITVLFLVLTNIGSIQAQNLSSPEYLTDLVLMCEETYYFDNRILDKKYSENREFRKRIDERNNDPRRPFFVLKYIDKKLSFNNDAVNFLINDIPGKSNEIGWVGNIHSTSDKIIFQLFNVEERTYYKTIITIERFTGLFKESRYSFGKNFPDIEANGKCSKKSTRLF